MSSELASKKIALVHDWLLGVGGQEKVLKALAEMFPEAPIYVLLHNHRFTADFLPRAEIRTSFLQRPFEILGSHKLLIPFLPLAVESLDLSGFDVVISSAPFSKGLVLRPNVLHIHCCTSPTRQAWDWQAEYRRESSKAPKSWLALFQHGLRLWDYHAASRVDHYIAYSETIRERIQKYYHRDAIVIYPPVSVRESLSPKTYNPKPKTYFLIVSRLYRHKNVHLAVKAFSKLEWPLVVIGDGPELNRLRRLANQSADIASSSADIVFLGYQPDRVVSEYYANCLAFVMPQEEDFGMTPIEAMSYGKPVLALKRGGALEYIQEGINGEFFEDPTEEMLADGARRLKENLPNYDPEVIKRTAMRFSTERFRETFKNFIATLIQADSNPPRQPLPPYAISQSTNRSLTI